MKPAGHSQNSWRNIQYSFLLILIVMVSGMLAVRFIQGQNAEEKKTVPVQAEQKPQIVDGKDAETNLIAADGYLTVKRICTACHSSKLITQNHLSRERWEKTIRWMQKTQGLSDLGELEKEILDYLAKYYGSSGQSRRKPLEKQNWYPLK